MRRGRGGEGMGGESREKEGERERGRGKGGRGWPDQSQTRCYGSVMSHVTGMFCSSTALWRIKTKISFVDDTTKISKIQESV